MYCTARVLCTCVRGCSPWLLRRKEPKRAAEATDPEELHKKFSTQRQSRAPGKRKAPKVLVSDPAAPSAVADGRSVTCVMGICKGR